jgi:hypothetical protein
MKPFPFLIRKNRHAATPRLTRFWAGKSEWEFEFTLPKTAWYTHGEIKHPGISKIIGLSFGIHAEKPFGSTPVLKEAVNSLVIGFEPVFDYQNYFKLFAINDNRGMETRPSLGLVVAANETVKGKIYKINGQGCYLEIMDDEFYYPMNALPCGYYLFPYFGGKSKAVRDMIISTNITSK